MGARSSRGGYQQWDLNELSRATGLPPQQIEGIYQEFMQAAGRDGQLSMNEFANLYRHFPGAQQQDQRYMQQQIPRIFRTFDRDNSGALSFDEFLGGVVMMNRNVPRRDRIDFLVRQNNSQGRQQGNGQISSQYGQQVFRRLNDYYGLPPGSENQSWQQVDRHNRGYVTHDEFMNYINQQEPYNRRYQY
jgi:Ca2+-binding EF-hand superfamily protein